MSHVTRLTQLEQQRCKLLHRRDAEIARAEQIIATANREFDKAVLPVAREINKLKAEVEESTPAPQKTGSSKKLVTFYDGLTDDEIQHYNELVAKRGR